MSSHFLRLSDFHLYSMLHLDSWISSSSSSNTEMFSNFCSSKRQRCGFHTANDFDLSGYDEDTCVPSCWDDDRDNPHSNPFGNSPLHRVSLPSRSPAWHWESNHWRIPEQKPSQNPWTTFEDTTYINIKKLPSRILRSYQIIPSWTRMLSQRKCVRMFCGWKIVNPSFWEVNVSRNWSIYVVSPWLLILFCFGYCSLWCFCCIICWFMEL